MSNVQNIRSLINAKTHLAAIFSRFFYLTHDSRQSAFFWLFPLLTLTYKIPRSGVLSRLAASTSCRPFFITSAGIHLRSTLTGLFILIVPSTRWECPGRSVWWILLLRGISSNHYDEIANEMVYRIDTPSYLYFYKSRLSSLSRKSKRPMVSIPSSLRRGII